MPKLRIGLVGANSGQSWAKFSHIPAIKSLPDLVLKAVSTRHEDSARDAAFEFGAPLWFSNFEKLVTDAEVDIVTVSVKVPDHKAIVLAALEAGKHVYCEWPLGKNLAETEQLSDAASKSKVHVAIGLQGSVHPASIKAAEIVHAGLLGRIKSVRMISTSMGFGSQAPSAYEYFDDPRSGANTTTIMGGHALDLLITLFGPIDQVESLSNIQFPIVKIVDQEREFERTVPDQVHMLLRHTNNVHSVVEIRGGETESFPFSLEIDGTMGTLSLTGGSIFGFQGGDLELKRDGQRIEIKESKNEGAAINVAELYSKFASDIEQNVYTVKDFKYAVELAKLLEIVSKSVEINDKH